MDEPAPHLRMKNRSNRRTGITTTGLLTFALAIISALSLIFATQGVMAELTNAKLAHAKTDSSQVAIQAPTRAPPQETHEGMVTDTKCGAKHSANIAKNASDCVRICVHGGANFALLDGDAAYVLNGDLDQVKKLAGQRAKITGALNGNTIEVANAIPES
jgi:uncharacterized low-complexity protein